MNAWEAAAPGGVVVVGFTSHPEFHLSERSATAPAPCKAPQRARMARRRAAGFKEKRVGIARWRGRGRFAGFGRRVES
jgi:hypothetical protein